MKKNITWFLCMAFVMSLVTSCIKDDAPGAGTAGTARVKIAEGPRQSLFFAPFSDVQTFDVFSLRRDEVSSAGISQEVTITLQADADAVDAYNAENETEYEVLPDSLYTIAGNGVTKNGNEIKITLPAKAVGNELTIAMDGSKWDVTHKYAMMYRIVDSASYHITDGLGSIFVTIEAKNRWDGVYEVTGSMADLASPGLTHINDYLEYSTDPSDPPPPMHYELRTISPTQCVVFDNYLYGGYYIPITSDGTGVSAYGSFAPIFTFDPATNEIIKVTNYYGQPASNTRSAELDPSGANAYDPDSKTISIKYFMLQPSVMTVAPYIRVKWDETWKYVGPRG